jgi:hypothetical protein
MVASSVEGQSSSGIRAWWRGGEDDGLIFD